MLISLLIVKLKHYESPNLDAVFHIWFKQVKILLVNKWINDNCSIREQLTCLIAKYRNCLFY